MKNLEFISNNNYYWYFDIQFFIKFNIVDTWNNNVDTEDTWNNVFLGIVKVVKGYNYY